MARWARPGRVGRPAASALLCRATCPSWPPRRDESDLNAAARERDGQGKALAAHLAPPPLSSIGIIRRNAAWRQSLSEPLRVQPPQLVDSFGGREIICARMLFKRRGEFSRRNQIGGRRIVLFGAANAVANWIRPTPTRRRRANCAQSRQFTCPPASRVIQTCAASSSSSWPCRRRVELSVCEFRANFHQNLRPLRRSS